MHWCLTIGCVTALTMAMADGAADNVQLDSTDAGRTAAEAQEGDPYVVRYLPGHAAEVFRAWSDGQIDFMIKTAADECDELVFIFVVADPVDHPFPVVEANGPGPGDKSFTLEYADGRVDFINYYIDDGHGIYLRCTIVGEGGAAFCQGDTDRSGVTDVVDLLAVLEAWGVCGGA